MGKRDATHDEEIAEGGEEQESSATGKMRGGKRRRDSNASGEEMSTAADRGAAVALKVGDAVEAAFCGDWYAGSVRRLFTDDDLIEILWSGEESVTRLPASEVRLRKAAEPIVLDKEEKKDYKRNLNILEQVLEKRETVDDGEEFHDNMHGSTRADDTPQSRKVFVGGLPWSADPEQVEKDFEECGDIDSFNMPRDKNTDALMGVAFIIYSNHEGVQKALEYDGTYYGRQKIRVRVADQSMTKSKGKLMQEQLQEGMSKDQSKAKDYAKPRMRGAWANSW
eukprot:TRINITY_DN10230_c0_g1_i1.p1 TRINITY_DN10230_c0_g1~~TRINITY_DN10230_c0_g1_i1.p1  ORF type:complete len:280 (-),score=86.14 TRINITY_DN10230_c0_g1_i1:647-1486(-)